MEKQVHLYLVSAVLKGDSEYYLIDRVLRSLCCADPIYMISNQNFTVFFKSQYNHQHVTRNMKSSGPFGNNLFFFLVEIDNDFFSANVPLSYSEIGIGLADFLEDRPVKDVEDCKIVPYDVSISRRHFTAETKNKLPLDVKNASDELLEATLKKMIEEEYYEYCAYIKEEIEFRKRNGKREERD